MNKNLTIRRLRERQKRLLGTSIELLRCVQEKKAGDDLESQFMTLIGELVLTAMDTNAILEILLLEVKNDTDK